MWIQRSPGASTISARASSRSGWAATVWARERTMRRPILGLGRLGMARTEWIVGRRHRPRDLTVGCSAHSSTHPEGGRDWPYEPPPTIPPPGAETVAIPTGSKTMAWEMRGRASPPASPRTASTRAEDSPHAGRCPEVQGVPDHLSARGALRLRPLLRPAGGRLRAHGLEPRGAQAPHPGGPAHAVALRGLPAPGGAGPLGAAHGLDAARARRPARRAAPPRPSEGLTRHRPTH